MFPLSVQDRMRRIVESAGPKTSLVNARKHLTQRYRVDQSGGFTSQSEAMAYIAARMPATFAALQAVLSQISLNSITSVLDLGAGPGTASLAAALHWPECKRFHLIEGDEYMGEVSQQLLNDIPEIAHQTFSFQHANLLDVSLNESYDLVIFSYVLNELSSKEKGQVLKQAWEKASKGLVIVMPGTPECYQQLMILRDLLIEFGAFIAAPCPHHKECPLKGDDWCHFSTRLSRSSLHREIKNVSLPFEDEKYSYLVALRAPITRVQARIIRNPLQRSGHVTLDLCTNEGIKRQTISRRDKIRYKTASKIIWGDSWDAV